ncbi:Hypothetical predicted protein [Marmota monax]|uniref:Uncharacterized protein n=1 Tax=Marmota monax TaxID=9995 RepID=A0A5E4DD47_MARMO|nr:hypothetical protein GHT09_015777 [Marmota monax]VTJ91072.1 Hypothetical predicted protein [Marmota monax]
MEILMKYVIEYRDKCLAHKTLLEYAEIAVSKSLAILKYTRLFANTQKVSVLESLKDAMCASFLFLLVSIFGIRHVHQVRCTSFYDIQKDLGIFAICWPMPYVCSMPHVYKQQRSLNMHLSPPPESLSASLETTEHHF